MLKNLIWALLMSPLCLFAQEHGVAFVHGSNWKEILQKAKTENKYIFMDCYATWCGPCKWMDQQVFPNDSVAAFINDRFIAVKVQMDTTKADNNEVKAWYATAQAFIAQYHIGAYPSFLFFSPDGQAVHKALGGQDINELLALAQSALDPQLQYYTLLANYRHGERSFVSMAVLADEALRMQQDSIALYVGRDYVQHFLETLPAGQLWTNDNILFAYRHPDAVHYEDKIFRSYFQNRKLVDSVMKSPGFSDQLINDVVYRGRVKPEIDKAMKIGTEPTWHRLEKDIAGNCNALYANKNVLQGRVEYYKASKKWANYVKYFILKLEESGIDTCQASEEHEINLNNAAFEVFQYSQQKRELEKALSWIDRALAMTTVNFAHAQAMDTKANILYKMGRKKDGLDLEEQSHKLSPRDGEITANYEKMKSGRPTWSAE